MYEGNLHRRLSEGLFTNAGFRNIFLEELSEDCHKCLFHVCNACESAMISCALMPVLGKIRGQQFEHIKKIALGLILSRVRDQSPLGKLDP